MVGPKVAWVKKRAASIRVVGSEVFVIGLLVVGGLVVVPVVTTGELVGDVVFALGVDAVSEPPPHAERKLIDNTSANFLIIGKHITKVNNLLILSILYNKAIFTCIHRYDLQNVDRT